MPYLKPKADQRDLEPGRRRSAERPRDPVGELVDVEVGGVDHQVGVGAQVGQQARARGGPVEQPAVALQRVRPADRLLAAHEHVVGGVEEQDQRDRRRAWPRCVEGGRELLEERPGADVDHDRDRLGGATLSSTWARPRAAACGGRLSTT